jgi:predicted RNase H-like HicB family nuclease
MRLVFSEDCKKKQPGKECTINRRISTPFAKWNYCMITNVGYMKTTPVPIIIESDYHGVFIVFCPQFKGRHTFGKTMDDALFRIKEVIELCMEDSKPEHLNTCVGFREVEIVQGA